MQPADRGTAAAILLAAHWISWRSPESVVAVFPSDHFIQGEAAFMSHVRAVAACVRRAPDRVVLLGAAPTDPEPQYGWIERGARVGRVGGEPLWRVRGFIEKPSPEAARRARDRGDLWNTFVMVGAVGTLLRLGREALPVLSERLAALEPVNGTSDEPAAVAHAYAGVPKADFCREVFQPYPSALSVSRLPRRIRWWDWGTTERVIASLRAASLTPAWLRDLDRIGGGAGLTMATMRPIEDPRRMNDLDQREELGMWQLRSVRWAVVLLLGLQTAELRAGGPFERTVSNEVLGLQWAAPGDTVSFRVTMSGGTPGALVTIYEQLGSSLSFHEPPIAPGAGLRAVLHHQRPAGREPAGGGRQRAGREPGRLFRDDGCAGSGDADAGGSGESRDAHPDERRHHPRRGGDRGCLDRGGRGGGRGPDRAARRATLAGARRLARSRAHDGGYAREGDVMRPGVWWLFLGTLAGRVLVTSGGASAGHLSTEGRSQAAEVEPLPDDPTFDRDPRASEGSGGARDRDSSWPGDGRRSGRGRVRSQ